MKWGYVTKEVITMEYVPGIKISDIDAIEAAGIDRKVRQPVTRKDGRTPAVPLCAFGFVVAGLIAACFPPVAAARLAAGHRCWRSVRRTLT